MSDPWFMEYASLRDDARVVRLARELGVRHAEVIGCITALRCWALVGRPDGVLEGLDAIDIEVHAKWEGPPGLFAKKAVDLGLIVQTPDGLYLAEWMEKNAGSYKEAKRKKDQREKDKPVELADNDATVAPESADVPGQSRTVPAMSPPEREKKKEIESDLNSSSSGPPENPRASAMRLRAALEREGWALEISAVEAKRCDELARSAPVTDDELAHAIAQAKERAVEPRKRTVYILGTIAGQREDAKRPQPKRPQRAARAETFGYHPGSTTHEVGDVQL